MIDGAREFCMQVLPCIEFNGHLDGDTHLSWPAPQDQERVSGLNSLVMFISEWQYCFFPIHPNPQEVYPERWVYYFPDAYSRFGQTIPVEQDIFTFFNRMNEFS